MKTIKEILKDKKGFSTVIGMMFSLMILVIIFSCFLNFAALNHKMTTLDQFADELAAKAGQQGRCSGKALDERYNQLVEVTGLKPNVEYVADFYDNSKKLVQYGDAITVKLTLDTVVIGYGDFSVPTTLKVKSTEQSMQYWK